MSLRQKIVLTVGCIFFLMMGAIYSITRVILINGYSELEERDIRHNIRQLTHIIESEVDQIKSFALDWGPWDDTYEFVVNTNQDYIDNNLIDETFLNFRLSFIAFVNEHGNFVYGKAYHLEKQESMPFPETLIEQLKAHPNLIGHRRNQDLIKGLLLLPDQIVLVTSVPILNSKFEGPIRGALIMGRFLNVVEIETIGEKVQLPLETRRWDDPNLPAEFKTAQSALMGKDSVSIQRNGPNRISAYILLRDIEGRSALIAKIEKERDIFRQGHESLDYFMVSLLAISLAFILVTLVFLEKSVLHKLAYLSKTVREIGMAKLFTPRITLEGKDELTTLARDINGMLEALRQSEERDKALLENIEDGYFEVDLRGDLTFFNDSICRITAYERSEMMGMNFRRLTNPSSIAKLAREFRQLYRSGQPIQAVEGDLICKNGEHRYLEASVSLILDMERNPNGFRGIVRDITQRKLTELALRESEERFRALFDRSLECVYIQDFTGAFTDANPAMLKLLGYERKEVSAIRLQDLLPQQQLRMALRAFVEINRLGYTKHKRVYQIRCRDGRQRFIEAQGALIYHSGKPSGILGVARDITQRRHMEAELKVQATTDPLTGAENRRRFLERADLEFQRFLRYGESFCLSALDIDHFKRINDTYGHGVGDEVLCRLVETCREGLRQTDFFGRMGGEEFAIVLVGADMKTANAIAERLRITLEHLVLHIGEQDIQFTVSMGLTEITSEDASFETVLKRADAALYAAKRQGRNRVVTDFVHFDDSMEGTS